jgi:hypothetical protein
MPEVSRQGSDMSTLSSAHGPSPAADIIMSVTTLSDRPSRRGETWNDTEAINRHRTMTPSQRVALAIQISRAALRFAHAERISDDRADVRA